MLIIDLKSSAMSPRCFSTHIWKEFWAWLMTWLNRSQAFGLSGAGCVGDWDVKYVLLAGTFSSLNVLSALLNYLYILQPSNNSIIGFLVTFQILFWYKDLSVINQSNVHQAEVIWHQNKQKFKSQHKTLLLLRGDVPLFNWSVSQNFDWLNLYWHLLGWQLCKVTLKIFLCVSCAP